MKPQENALNKAQGCSFGFARSLQTRRVNLQASTASCKSCCSPCSARAPPFFYTTTKFLTGLLPHQPCTQTGHPSIPALLQAPSFPKPKQTLLDSSHIPGLLGLVAQSSSTSGTARRRLRTAPEAAGENCTALNSPVVTDLREQRADTQQVKALAARAPLKPLWSPTHPCSASIRHLLPCTAGDAAARGHAAEAPAGSRGMGLRCPTQPKLQADPAPEKRTSRQHTKG